MPDALLYFCPSCGQRFTGTITDAGDSFGEQAANAHCRAGFRACTATPPGFRWDCAACGFATGELFDARRHAYSNGAACNEFREARGAA